MSIKWSPQDVINAFLPYCQTQIRGTTDSTTKRNGFLNRFLTGNKGASSQEQTQSESLIAQGTMETPENLNQTTNEIGGQ